MQNQISYSIKTAALAFAAFVLVASVFAVSPTLTRAADLPNYDTSWVADSYTDYYYPSYDNYDTSWIADSYTDYYYPSYNNDTSWIADSYTDYYYPSYSYDNYSYTPSYTPSYNYIPSYSYSSSGGGSQHQNQDQNQQQTQSTIVSNNNYNNNNVIVNVPASQPPVVYVPPTSYYPVPTCTLSASQTYFPYNYYNSNQPVTLTWSSSNANSGYITSIGSVSNSGSRVVYLNTTTTYTGTFYGQNGQNTTCSVTITFGSYIPSYPTTPYVTLSQVPYTGLDLGPVDTALYWGFLVLWCLFAAYIITVKKAHVKVANSMKNFLFGTSSPAPIAPVAQTSSDLEVIVNTVRAILEGSSSKTTHTAVSSPVKTTDAVDDFVMSQVNRVRA